MVDFKDRLKAALEHAGLTPVQLASRLGVTRQAIENAAKGRSDSLSAENCAKAGRPYFRGNHPAILFAAGCLCGDGGPVQKECSLVD